MTETTDAATATDAETTPEAGADTGSDTDAAAPCATIACSGHGHCATSSGEPECICDDGYAPNLLVREDIDECALDLYDCSAHEQCVNLET